MHENPAGRLHEILTQLKGSSANSKLKNIWADVLGIDKNDEMKVVRQVIEVYRLTLEVEKLIKLKPEINHELYLASFDIMENITSPTNFHKLWHEVSGQFETDVLTRLEFCSYELSRFYEEERVSEEEILEISEMVESLFEELNNSSIDDVSKLLLLEEIERIRHALANYRIKGAKGVKEALQATLGSVMVNKEQLKPLAKNSPETLDRLVKLLDKLDAFSSKAIKLHKVLSKPISYMLSFSKDEESA